MTAVLLPNGKQQYLTTAGLPAVGYKVATFDAGTSNPRTTWSDALKVGANTNPILLDARGEASIFWEGAYKVQLQDSTGAVIWTQDNLQSQPGFSTALVPSTNNAVDLGSAVLSWRNGYFGTNVLVGPSFAPVFDTASGNVGYYVRTAAEIAAAVTPVNFSYPPYDIRRYGSVGTGANDSAVFNLAGSIGPTITVPELGAGASYTLNSSVTGLFQAIGHPRFVGAGTIGLVSDLGVPMDANNGGLVGSFPGQATILAIGDSITAGGTASAYVNSWAWLAGRSLMNHCNEGTFYDPGFGYHTILNFNNLGATPGVTATGTLAANGIWQARTNLAVGQNLTFTQREVVAISVTYDATASAGATFAVQLNGVTVTGGTVVVSGAGLKETGFIFLKAPNHILTRLSDSIAIVSTVGTVQICDVTLTKNSNSTAMIFHVGGQSGYAYQDYNTTGAMDELAFYLNSQAIFASVQSKVLICQLGTNNMYNAGRALSPTATVAAIATLIAGMKARCTNLQVLISIPPRSNEALFPMILAFKYEDYVRALVAYCVANSFSMIRHDMGALNSTAYYVDGLHPNDVGHTIFAQSTLQTMGVKYDKFFKSVEVLTPDYLTYLRQDAVVTMNGPWASLGGTALAARAHVVAGQVTLSGVVAPNGSGSTTIGTVPAGARPDTADRFFIAPKNVSGGAFGLCRIAVRTATGNIDIDAIPTNDVSLDGITFPLWKYIET